MSFSLQGMWEWAIAWCNRPNVEYYMSMYYRNMGLLNGYITCFDCSSFTFFAIWLGGGYDVGQLGFSTDLQGYIDNHGAVGYNAWDVSGMRRCLPYIGFSKIEPIPTTWKPGDILVKLHKHTEICYASPRQTMGAHYRNGLAPAQQVSINSFQTEMGYYDELWRYGSEIQPDPIGSPIPPPPYVPGDPGYERKMPLWMMTKPWWKV